MLPDLLARRQPHPGLRRVALAGSGAATAIAVLGLLGSLGPVALLAAPFGATCVLVFALPAAPLSQPANVVGGHLVTTACGLAVLTLAPVTWWSTAIAVGAGVSAMVALRLTHPPAGANPVIVMSAAVGWEFLVAPVLVGSVLLVLVAVVFHRATSTAYPVRGRQAPATLVDPAPAIPGDIEE
ncbi:HPP family protein [Paraoerskovia marina]|uniref:HPP family protein n=1 Tax=Paraoerskovia marina TaxID=545619 RepID=A0A1H1Q482_9CELL|nr:HPP family protein [Paraoerskovia marina]SDS18235.1 HPP family protein [Paraoerskovia marina]